MRTVFACLLLIASPAAADELAAKIEEVTKRPEYKQARWGILVVDAESGKVVYEHQPERLFIPASTTKLYSGAAALIALGPDHRFQTPVYQRGEVKNGKLGGDLILVASGDLTFGSRVGKDGKTLFANNDHTYANSGLMEPGLTDSDPRFAFDDIARQVAKAGIKSISGEILIDDRLFQRARGTGSGPDLLTPVIVNDNVLDIVITPGKNPGDLATVRVRPENAYFQMDAEVATIDKGKPPTLTLQETSMTTFSVRGSVAVDSKPLVRVYHLPDPALFARAMLIEALRRQNIIVEASLFQPARHDLPPRADYEKLTKVAVHESAPFAEALRVTMKVSHNLYASTFPLLVAAKNGETTLEEGMKREGKLLKELGVPVETITFGGGAGGAVADMTTPRATVTLLQEMAKRKDAKAYFDSLPVLGVDGTLAESVAESSPARGKVRAKTGTLVGYDALNGRMLLRSKALAGTMETAKGTKLYFAMFLNDMPMEPEGKASEQGKVLGGLCEVIHQHGP